MMSFRLSSEAAGSGFPEKSSGDADNATDPKSPRDTPYGSKDKWQNKTHILSFNPLLMPRSVSVSAEAERLDRLTTHGRCGRNDRFP